MLPDNKHTSPNFPRKSPSAPRRATSRASALLTVAIILLAVLAVGAASSWLAIGFVRRAERPMLPEGFPKPLDLGKESEDFRDNFRGAYDTAREAMSQTELDADSARSVARLGDFFLANGHINPAIWCYAAARDIDPENPIWPHSLGFAYHLRGQNTEALTQFERSAALAPESVAAHLRLGQALQCTGQAPHARAQFERVLELEPGNAWALLGLASLEFEAGDKESAEKRLRSALEAEAQLAPASRLLARIEYERGPDDAVEERILRIAPGRPASAFGDPWADDIRFFCFDPELLLTRALVAFQHGDEGAQRKLFMRMMSLGEENPNLHLELAAVFADREQYLDALAAYENLLEMLPEDKEVLLGHALALLKARRPVVQIEEAFARAIESAPGDPEPLTDFAHYQILEQQAERAEEYARQAVALDPSYGRALNILGNALKLQERYAEALDLYRQASRQYVDYKGILNTIADSLRSMNKLDATESCLQTSIEVQPLHPDTWYSMCRLAEARGDQEKASAYRYRTNELMATD